jgi:20S proteasome alpha/beta subunit
MLKPMYQERLLRVLQKCLLLSTFTCLLHPILVCSKPTTISYPFNKPNPYVSSSPPCLAASCKNGISLIVIHIPDSPLADNIGPVRVEQIDEYAVLLNAGWRVDGAVLAENAREICSRDSATYGTPFRDREYGTRLGYGLVDYLVECHVKNSSRSLATVGLLATNACENELYLVDVTGLYPCRAIAIGSHSEQINRFLASVDFRQVSVEEGSEILLGILRDCRRGKTPEIVMKGNDGDDQTQMEDVKDEDAWHIPDSSIVEIVTMKSKGGTNAIQRRRETFLPSSLQT